MSEAVVTGIALVREAGTPSVPRAEGREATRDRSARLQAMDAVGEQVAVVVVSLMLACGLILAWQVLRQSLPRDDSLGWAGIVFRTNAFGTAFVAVVAAIRALTAWVLAMWRHSAG